MRFVIVMFSKSKLCAGVLSILRNSQTPVAWRLREEAGHIHRLLSCPHIPDPELIGRGKNAIADRITLHVGLLYMLATTPIVPSSLKDAASFLALRNLLFHGHLFLVRFTFLFELMLFLKKKV